MNIFEMSFFAGVMIFVVIIIRKFASKKLSNNAFMILWEVILFRLLVPFSLTFRFSIYEIMSSLKKSNTVENITKVTNNIGNIIIDNISQTQELPKVVISYPNYIFIINIIWVLGVTISLLFFTITYIKSIREFKTAIPINESFFEDWKSKHKIKRKIQICQSEKITTPLTYGFLHPVILLPKFINYQKVDNESLEFILEHEYTHIKRFDVVFKILMTLATCIHWFNPLVWMMYTISNQDIELTCDKIVIKKFGVDSKKAYANTLVDMEEIRGGLYPLCTYFNKNSTKERIESIMKLKKSSIFGIIVACFVVITVSVVFATSGTKIITRQEPNNSYVENKDFAMNVETLVSDRYQFYTKTTIKAKTDYAKSILSYEPGNHRVDFSATEMGIGGEGFGSGMSNSYDKETSTGTYYVRFSAFNWYKESGSDLKIKFSIGDIPNEIGKKELTAIINVKEILDDKTIYTKPNDYSYYIKSLTITPMSFFATVVGDGSLDNGIPKEDVFLKFKDGSIMPCFESFTMNPANIPNEHIYLSARRYDTELGVFPIDMSQISSVYIQGIDYPFK